MKLSLCCRFSCPVKFKCIAVDNIQLRISPLYFAQNLQTPLVHFYRRQLFRILPQHGLCQPARAGTDLGNSFLCQVFPPLCRQRQPHNLIGNIPVQQKILPQGFLRHQPVFFDKLSRTRQGIFSAVCPVHLCFSRHIPPHYFCFLPPQRQSFLSHQNFFSTTARLRKSRIYLFAISSVLRF